MSFYTTILIVFSPTIELKKRKGLCVLFQSILGSTMLIWTSFFIWSLIYQGGYSKHQDQNEDEPEASWGDVDAKNGEKPWYVPEVLALFGKLFLLKNT